MGYKMGKHNGNSLYDRVNKLLVSYEWSDCCFSVSGKKFKAHKLILGISSPVFEAMFYGPMSSNNDIIICITDIEPEIFQLLLNYIYTDKIEMSSIEEAFELLYVSRKYLLEHLTEICISYIETNITVDNVITILNYPDYMQNSHLVAAALILFSEHANYVLSEYLSTISLSCMQRLLQCSSMNISEKNLIKYVFKWTQYQCNVATEFEKRRSILIDNGLFHLFRFAVLSLDELQDILSSEDNMLLPSESDRVRQIIANVDYENKQMVKFISTTSVPRNKIELQWKHCHRSPLRSMSPVIIDNHNNSIQTRIKANKSVFINSVTIPSRMASVINFYNNATNIYCEEFNVSVVGEYDSNIKKDISIKKAIEYDSNFDVVFSQPLFLKKHQWYTIDFVWPKQRAYYSYSYAVQSRDSSYNNSKVEFQFEDLLSTSDSSGSFLKGLTFCM